MKRILFSLPRLVYDVCVCSMFNVQFNNTLNQCTLEWHSFRLISVGDPYGWTSFYRREKENRKHSLLLQKKKREKKSLLHLNILLSLC